jgi:hypothetical protein
MNRLMTSIVMLFVAGTILNGQSKDLSVTLPDSGKLKNGKAVGPGWVSLIDNLKGWNFTVKNWSLKDGIMQGRHDGGKYRQHAWTKMAYTDFELHTVFKLSGKKPNSGVCFRVNKANHDVAPGYQMDIGIHHWGYLFESNRSGMVQSFPRKLGNELAKVNEWNHYYIIARGHHIQAWLNGVKTVDIVHESGFLKGSFGFELPNRNYQTHLDVKTFLVKELKKNPKK